MVPAPGGYRSRLCPTEIGSRPKIIFAHILRYSDLPAISMIANRFYQRLIWHRLLGLTRVASEFCIECVLEFLGDAEARNLRAGAVLPAEGYGWYVSYGSSGLET